MLLLTSVAILLLLSSVIGFFWHERKLALDQATGLAERRAARLADDLQQTLVLAKLAMAQAEQALSETAAANDINDARLAWTKQRSELLAKLALPFELRLIDARGQVVEPGRPALAAATAASSPALQRQAPTGAPDRWQIGATQGQAGKRILPMVLRSERLPAGLAGFTVDLSHDALQQRFEADRLTTLGGIALFRVEADGSASVLARAPFVESELGTRVRGPLVQALKLAPSGSFDAMTQIDGRRRIVAYRRLSDGAEPLVLAYGMSTDVVLASWHGRLPYIAGISLLLSLGMAWGGWRLSQSLREMNRSHRALAQSEQHFRALADNLPDVVIQVDRAGQLVYANAAIERAMGLKPTAAVGQTLALLGQPAEQQAAWLDCVQGLYDDGKAQRLAFSRGVGDGPRSHWESLLVLEQRGDGETPMALMISRDISARRAAEDALRASESRLAYLLRSAPTVVYTAIAEGDFGATFYSPNLYQLLGWQPSQFVADSGFWLDHVHPDDREQVLAHMAILPEHGELVLEYRFEHADGRWRWMRDAVRLLRDPAGGPDELVGSWIDISERVEAEQHRQATLRDSEALMRHFFDSGLVGMAITNAGQTGGQFNTRLLEMLGYSDAQLQELTWPEITHPDDLAVDLAQFNRLLAGEIEAYRLDKRLIRGDGSLLDAAKAVHCQRNGSGQPLRLFTIIEDISKHKLAEARLELRVQQRTAELARSESRWRNIFETVPVAIGEEDWSEVQTLLRSLRDRGVLDASAYFAAHPEFVQQCLRAVRVLRLNQKALQLHDASGRALDLPNLQAFYPGKDDLPQFVGELEALWAGQRHYSGDKALPSLTGRPLRLMLTMSLPALDDDDGTALVCLVDISEIDRLNSELDNSLTRLRQVNQELETFTYSVSHDLKAPLRGIDGYSRLLLSEHSEQLSPEAQQFLQRIRQATQQMGVLIDDLLSYSRLERREQTLVALPLAAIVHHVLQACEQELQSGGVKLQVSVAAELRAWGDAQGLTMCLRNLVDNALKFSRESPEPRIDISASLVGDKLQLSVRDNGTGFDMRFHDRIFAIFQRLHRAEDFPGTGVGLAIVRKAIERMGGRVFANSKPGEGASFTLELPQAAAVIMASTAHEAPHRTESSA